MFKVVESFEAQLLGLLRNILEAEADTGLHLLLLDTLDALVNVGYHVGLDALDELLQDGALVLGLDQVEARLDAVEFRAVGHVEYRFGFEILAGLNDFLRLVHPEVVHEDCELSASCTVCEDLDEV